MDAIRLRQIEEVMGNDNHINTMVVDMKRKRVSQTIREKPEDQYALIDAQKMLDGETEYLAKLRTVSTAAEIRALSGGTYADKKKK